MDVGPTRASGCAEFRSIGSRVAALPAAGAVTEDGASPCPSAEPARAAGARRGRAREALPLCNIAPPCLSTFAAPESAAPFPLIPCPCTASAPVIYSALRPSQVLDGDSPSYGILLWMNGDVPLGPAEIRRRVSEVYVVLRRMLGLADRRPIPLAPIHFRPRSGATDGLVGLYDPLRRQFRFTLPFRTGAYANVVVGEEVTHFLHQRLRPDLFRNRAKLIRWAHAALKSAATLPVDLTDLRLLMNYTEGVGLYAGFLVAEKLHGRQAVEDLFRTGQFHTPEVLLDAAYEPYARGLPRPVQNMGFNYGIGYALAIRVYEHHRKQGARRLRSLFWAETKDLDDLIRKYDAEPRMSPCVSWRSEAEVRREGRSRNP